MGLDLLIRNATVVDGSGAPRYRADVGVQNGRIAELGRIRTGAQRTIDADGLILAPGKAAILPVAIAGFNTFRGVQIGSMSAAILIAVVPVVIASFFIQRRLVQGISGGAVKF